MTQAELERRILALERAQLGGGTCGAPGLSTLFGVPSVAYRDRFPAILTSTFNTTTGYNWNRLFLTTGTGTSTVTTATGPQSGSYAFTPDNDTTLAVGDRGWLEADPTAQGWIFLPMAGAAAPVYGISGSFSSTVISADTTYTASGLTLSIPSAGTYLLFGKIMMYGDVNGTPTNYMWAGGKLRNDTDAVDIGATEGIGVFIDPLSPSPSLSSRGGWTFVTIETFNGAKTLQMYGYRSAAAGTTWNAGITPPYILNTNAIESHTYGSGRSNLGYYRLGD